jgi:hypothetical protein
MAGNTQKGSLFSRLTKLFRSGPIVRRRVRDYRQQGASSALEVFRKAHSDVYNSTLSAYGAFDRMSRYSDFSEMEACIAGDTLIAVPDGYTTIEELSKKYGPDETFVVYSYDHSKKQIVPALGKQARKTTTAHAVKITFDSGKTLICTPDHRVMRRDGTYCEAQDLLKDDSLMPFYRKDLFQKDQSDSGDGYRWIYTMDYESSTLGNGWVAEHRLIAAWIANKKLKKDEVVHHVNFKKNDNRPENLMIMTEYEHKKYHAEILNGKKWHQDNSKWISEFKKNHAEFMRKKNPAARSDITFELMLNLCELYGFNMSSLSKRLDCSENVIYSRLRDKGFLDFSQFAKAYDRNWKPECYDNLGSKNPRYDHELTFQKICSSYKEGMSLIDMTKKLDTTWSKLKKRLQDHGFKNWDSFTENFSNHKVVSVEDFGTIDLYDLTVDGYKNYATDSIIVHNTPEIASALDIYAEETVSSDESGKVLHVYSENKKIQEILEELFYDVLNVDFNLVMWVRNLVKYGDFFLFNDISPEYGVINAYPIPISEIEREEGFDPNDPSAVRFRWITQGNQTLEKWQISHFRLLGNDAFLPYGSSVLESARRIWRQLIMMEDAMLVYRVIRAPERRVFYIDVGNTPPEDIAGYIEQAQSNLKRNPVIDKTSGKVDLRYNPLSVDEDYFLPVRGGESGTKIDTLAGGQNTAAIEDVQYIQKKLFAALKIPKAYLGYDEDTGAKATLAQEDIRFSRSIGHIQKVIIAELNQLAMVHLYCHGFEDEDLADFTLNLTNPSSTAQQQKLQLIKSKFEIAAAAPEGVVDRQWIRKKIIGLTNEEIDAVKKGRKEDKKEDAEIEAVKGPEGGGGGLGGAPAGGETGGEAGGGEPGGLFAGDVKQGDLLTAKPGSGTEEDTVEDDDFDQEVSFSIDDIDAPVKAEKKLMNMWGGPIVPDRKVKGPKRLDHVFPDTVRMTGLGDANDTLRDPTDRTALNSLFSFNENARPAVQTNLPRITRDFEKTIRSLGKRLNRSKKSLLSEDLDLEIEQDQNDEA